MTVIHLKDKKVARTLREMGGDPAKCDEAAKVFNEAIGALHEGDYEKMNEVLGTPAQTSRVDRLKSRWNRGISSIPIIGAKLKVV